MYNLCCKLGALANGVGIGFIEILYHNMIIPMCTEVRQLHGIHVVKRIK